MNDEEERRKQAEEIVKAVRSQYGKERVMVGVPVSQEILEVLERAQTIPGVRPDGFYVDLTSAISPPGTIPVKAGGALWLYYVGDDSGALNVLGDVVNIEGGLPVKMAGFAPKEPDGIDDEKWIDQLIRGE